MNDTRQVERKRYLVDWARAIERAALRGLFGGQPIALKQTELIAGPRAGALQIYAGLSSSALLRAFNADDSAILRQFITWNFSGEPSAYMAGRAVRVEAGWPVDLADSNIKLSEMNRHPVGAGRWLMGRHERGSALTAGLNDDTPHWLASGTTGSGKTTALVSIVCQLASDPTNRLILIDCKHGSSYRKITGVRGLIGPIADDVYSARSALTWACEEMAMRYSGSRDTRRLVIVIDELQELSDDALATEALRKLIAQGRGAGVHCILATQHPTVASLGDATIGKNLVGRLALRVIGPEASRVAVGAKFPRADYLQGHGDGYAVSLTATHRVQVCVYDSAYPTGDPDLDAWPEADTALPDSGWPSGPEIGAAVLGATRGDGRVKLQRTLRDLAGLSCGNDKAVKLLALGRDVLDWLNQRGASVRPGDDTHTDGAITAEYTVN